MLNVQDIPLKALKPLRTLVILACLVLCALLLHKFFTFADKTPYLAVDDSVANISYSMATTGRIGFPASPIQSPNLSLRTDGLYNFGPWYFAIGAALIWLFGFSIELMRSIHPFGILMTVFIAVIAFRKHSLAAAGIYCLAAYTFFIHYQWPMIRPDIMVSVFAFLAIYCLGASFSRQDPCLPWAGAGFFAILAFTTHQICAALLPALGVVWTVQALFAANRERRLASLFSMIGGGLAGLTLYLLAINFRIAELLEFYRAYYAERSTKNAMPYLDTLAKHFHFAFFSRPDIETTVAVIYAACLLALLLSLRARQPLRDNLFSLLAPPFFLGLGYLLSLGFYPNYHAGYEIFVQLAPFWIAAALAAAVIVLITQTWKPLGMAVNALSCLIVAGIILTMAWKENKLACAWEISAGKNVSASEYVNRVMESLPSGASAWGSVFFGLETGGRINLAQLGDAVTLARWYKPESADRIAPDYLIIGYPELMSFTLARLRGRETNLAQVMEVFPRQCYRLTGLVLAPPYGTTRIYQRSSPHDRPAPPRVACNLDGGPQWMSQAGPPEPVVFTPVQPARFAVSYPVTVDATAVSSIAATVPPGVYLAEIKLMDHSTSGPGMITATKANHFADSPFSELSLGFASAPYFPWDDTVWLLVEAPDGQVCLSQFDSGQAKFEVASLRPLRESSPAPVVNAGSATPPLSSWMPQAGTTVLSVNDEAIVMRADATAAGYQLTSPPIPVKANQMYSLRFSLALEEGEAAAGILDSNGNWLVPPRRSGPVEFNSNGHSQLTIVVANNFASPPPHPSAVFRFSSPHLSEVFPKERYIDRLTDCHPSLPARAPYCLSKAKE